MLSFSFGMMILSQTPLTVYHLDKSEKSPSKNLKLQFIVDK